MATQFDMVISDGRGNLSGMNKFGRNSNIATNTTADIWDGGIVGGASLIWVPPAAAVAHNYASTSVNDVVGGSGAQRIRVFGLDEDYDWATELVDMNGQTDVPSRHKYWIIHRMTVEPDDDGTVGDADGNITATTIDGATTVTAQITAGFNQTLMAIFQMPRGHVGDVTRYRTSLNRGNTSGAADMVLWAKPYGGVWQVKGTESLMAAGTSSINSPVDPYIDLGEKDMIKWQATVTGNTNDVSAGFGIAIRNQNKDRGEMLFKDSADTLMEFIDHA